MTYEQAQAYMRRLTPEERKALEELMEALSPRGCRSCPVRTTEQEKRKEK